MQEHQVKGPSVSQSPYCYLLLWKTTHDRHFMYNKRISVWWPLLVIVIQECFHLEQWSKISNQPKSCQFLHYFSGTNCYSLPTFWHMNDACAYCCCCMWSIYFYPLKVTEYLEWAWFKNNFANMFSAYYFDAGVTTTIISMPFRSLWGKLALQESVRSYFTRARRYSRYTVQIFAVRF